MEKHDNQEHEKMGWPTKILCTPVDNVYDSDQTKQHTRDCVGNDRRYQSCSAFCDDFSKSFVIVGVVMGSKRIEGRVEENLEK